MRNDEIKITNNHPWRKIIKTVFKKPGYAIGLISFVVLLALLDVIYPLLNQYAINQYFSDNPNFNNVTIFIVGYLILALFYGFTVFGFLFY
ncbi:MAG: hypothetical protein IJY14_01975 [Acholeplasmatales bacterium]|nr:hypothetical protein [Acholeplasmatales bacterium]